MVLKQQKCVNPFVINQVRLGGMFDNKQHTNICAGQSGIIGSITDDAADIHHVKDC